MGKIDVFKLSHGVGDRVVIYRNSGGGDIRGVVEDIGDGYIQKTSYMNMFVNIADKELREAVSNDPNYIDALKNIEILLQTEK